MASKLLNLIALPGYIWLFTEVIDIAVSLMDTFGVDVESSSRVLADVAERYVYQPLYGVSQLPVIGTFVDILWWIAFFEVLLLITKLIFRFLEWSNIAGRSVIEV